MLNGENRAGDKLSVVSSDPSHNLDTFRRDKERMRVGANKYIQE